MNNFNIFLLVVAGSFASPSIFAAPPSNSKAQISVQQNLGISADQFKANYNKLASQIGVPQIKSIRLENENQGKSFSIQMPNHLAIIGNTDNKGLLTRLSVGLDLSDVPNNEIIDHSRILGGFAITVIKALDQNKNDEKRDDAVQDVYESLLNDKKSITSSNTKYKVYKNYKLAAFSDPRMGIIMIGAENNKR